MKKTSIGVLIAAATTIGTAAFAQPPQAAGPDPTWTPPSVPQPPPPPQAPAAPSYSYSYAPPAPAVTIVAAPASGQWVYTNQYGWIWVPYSAEYTYAPSADVAYSYVYYPRFGWRWIASPWVLGIGPTPRWGRLGPVHFAWYGHPHSYVVAHGGWRAPARPVYRAPAPRVAARGIPVRAGHGGHGGHGGHAGHAGHSGHRR